MTALDPTMRVGRQVALALGRREGVSDLLARVELSDPERVMRSFPHQLSGGMAQRVVIAMAIARRPLVVVADEPTASLDASVRDRVMATLGRLRAETQGEPRDPLARSAHGGASRRSVSPSCMAAGLSRLAPSRAC